MRCLQLYECCWDPFLKTGAQPVDDGVVLFRIVVLRLETLQLRLITILELTTAYDLYYTLLSDTYIHVKLINNQTGFFACACPICIFESIAACVCV